MSSIDSDGLRVIGNSDLSKFEELRDDFVELVAFGKIKLVSKPNTKVFTGCLLDVRDLPGNLVWEATSANNSTKYGRSFARNLVLRTMFSRECVEENSPPSSSTSRVIRSAERLSVDYQLIKRKVLARYSSSSNSWESSENSN